LLPPVGHKARELFTVEDLVAIATGERTVPTCIVAMRRSALGTFQSCAAAERIAFIRLNPSSDNLELVTFGRRGGWRREWTFGPVTRAARVS
jgi:hypothetical protein